MALWGSDLHKLMAELVKGRRGLYLSDSQELHIPAFDTLLSGQATSYNLRPSLSSMDSFFFFSVSNQSWGWAEGWVRVYPALHCSCTRCPVDVYPAAQEWWSLGVSL